MMGSCPQDYARWLAHRMAGEPRAQQSPARRAGVCGGGGKDRI